MRQQIAVPALRMAIKSSIRVSMVRPREMRRATFRPLRGLDADSGSVAAKKTSAAGLISSVAAKFSYGAAKFSYAVGSETIAGDKNCQKAAEFGWSEAKFTSAAATLSSIAAETGSISAGIAVLDAQRSFGRVIRTIELAKFSCIVAK